MTQKLPWVRLYTELPMDPKMRRRPVAQRWLWTSVMCAAGASPIRGTLMVDDGTPMSVSDLSDFAALSTRQVREGLESFTDSDMIRPDLDTGGLVIVKFNERNFKSDVDAAARQRKSRNLRGSGSDVT